MDTKNRILFDWLTFTTREDTLTDVFNLIGIDFDKFIKMDKGCRGYKQRYYFEGITIAFDGSKWVDDKGNLHDMGIMVDMCGKGCRAFESYSTKSFRDIFDYIIDNLEDYNITRLDVAFDDFENILDINLLASDFMSENYVTRFQNAEMDFSRKSGINGISLYFGSEQSDLMYRIYDKKAEQKIIDDSMHWVRFEMQCRNIHAETFVSLICQDFDIAEVFFNTLNNQLRFVVPSSTDSNKRRWKITDYWKKFLQYRGVMSLYKAPGQEYNDDNLISYLNNYSGALYTLCCMYGIEFLLHFLKKRSCYKFNAKYESFLQSKGVRISSLPSEIDMYLEHLNDNIQLNEDLKIKRKNKLFALKRSLLDE